MQIAAQDLEEGRLAGAVAADDGDALTRLDAQRRLVERRVNELEKAGWSLPMYRELILADAAKVNF